MFRLIGAGLLGLALLLNIVGVATKGWITRPSISFGLFFPVNVNLQVTVAFNILGELALIAAITLSVINHNNKTEGTQGKSGGIVGLVAGVLILIGVGNFTRAFSYVTAFSHVAFGYSFGLAWTSFVLAMVGGGLSMKTD